MKKPGSFFFIVAAIAAIGMVSLYSAAYYERAVFIRQVIWLILGFGCFLFFSRFSYHNLKSIVWIIYGVTVLLLVLVLVLGAVRLGAQRWIKIWWFNFQPSELAKLTGILVLADYFSKRSIYELDYRAPKGGLIKSIIIPSLFIGFLSLPILMQPDLGTASILLLSLFAIFFVSGIKKRFLLFLLFAAIILSPVFWHFLKDYQKDRLAVFINPSSDPLGAGYTIIQSKIAIGSGGFFGTGWLKGTQGQLNFLPEGHTDFIFATFAEEWGFLGSAAVLILYYLLIAKCIRISSSTHDAFGRLLGFGISFCLAIQILINISMTMGLCPVVGLPLPLFSYGGSSIILTMISLGIINNISRARTVF